MSATQAATSSVVGGSLWSRRSWSRTEPMSIDVAAVACGVAPALPRISSVDPPPMSTTRTGSVAGARRSRTAPSNARAASSAPLSTSGQTPSRSWTPCAKTSPLAASRVADVAQKRIRSGGTPCAATSAAYSSTAAKVRASASSSSLPVRSTPCPSRTIRETRTDV